MSGVRGAIGCLGWMIIIVLALNLTLGGFATEYVAEYWVSEWKGYPVDYPFWQCAIAGLFLGEFTIPATVITWLIRTADENDPQINRLN